MSSKDLIKGSKLEKDVKRNGVGTVRVTILSKVTKSISNFFVEVFALWRLIVTVAQAMGAYILIPQSAWGDKIIGVVLLISAVSMAVKQYTNHE